jgi:hypothetical protein
MSLDLFFYVMFFIFLTLKLAGCINWSWGRVTSPLWFPWCVVAVIYIVVIFTACTVGLFVDIFRLIT